MKTQLITLSVVLAALCACTQPTPRQKAEKEAQIKAQELLDQREAEMKNGPRRIDSNNPDKAHEGRL